MGKKEEKHKQRYTRQCISLISTQEYKITSDFPLIEFDLS